MTDTRIVYGSKCCWWDSIDKIATIGELRLPCCPHCKGPLYEAATIEEWYKDVDAYARAEDPKYREYVDWIRGKCFRDYPTAREAFDNEQNRRHRNEGDAGQGA